MYWKNKGRVKSIFVPYGFGTILYLSQTYFDHPYKYFMKLKQENKDLKGLALCSGSIKEYVVLDVEGVKDFVLTNVSNLKKIDIFFFVDQIFLKGILFTDGGVWKNQRKVLSQKFVHQEFQKKVPMVNEVCDYFYSKLKKDEFQQNELKCCRFFMNISGEVILRFFLGIDSCYFQDEKKDLLLSQVLQEIAIELGETFIHPLTLLKGDLLPERWWNKPSFEIFLDSKQKKIKHDFFALKKQLIQLLQQQIEAFRKGMLTQDSILFTILEDIEKNQKQDTFEDNIEYIFQQFMNLFFAGMDTSGITTGMTLYSLLQNKNHLEKVKQEINDIQSQQDLYSKKNFYISKDSVEKMEHLTLCIKETLRIHSTVGGLIPKITTQECQFDGVSVPKGTVVYLPGQINQISGQYFPDPLEFKPERWLDNKTVSQPHSYIPFSAGPRNCLGQYLAMIQLKIIISKFLLQFQMIEKPEIEFSKVYLLTLQPKNEKLFRVKEIK